MTDDPVPPRADRRARREPRPRRGGRCSATSSTRTASSRTSRPSSTRAGALQRDRPPGAGQPRVRGRPRARQRAGLLHLLRRGGGRPGEGLLPLGARRLDGVRAQLGCAGLHAHATPTCPTTAGPCPVPPAPSRRPGCAPSSPRCRPAPACSPTGITRARARASATRTSPTRRPQPLVDALAEQGAALILTGHSHNYERFDLGGGLTQFVVGTGGREHHTNTGQPPLTTTLITDVFGVLELTLVGRRLELALRGRGRRGARLGLRNLLGPAPPCAPPSRRSRRPRARRSPRRAPRRPRAPRRGSRPRRSSAA